MPSFPALVATSQVIGSAWGNGIRNALIAVYDEVYAWTANVDGGAHAISNVVINSNSQTWSGAVNANGQSLTSLGSLSVVGGGFGYTMQRNASDGVLTITPNQSTANGFNFQVKSGAGVVGDGLKVEYTGDAALPMGGIRVVGQIHAVAANATVMDFAGGKSRIIGVGPNTSTQGAVQIQVVSSNVSVASVALECDLNANVLIYNSLKFVQGLGNFANDAAAATAGLPIGFLYRNGSQVMIRVT